VLLRVQADCIAAPHVKSLSGVPQETNYPPPRSNRETLDSDRHEWVDSGKVLPPARQVGTGREPL